ncbi:MAG: hypothetical protein F6K18_18575 [Okeania sp. SIO2C2]|uniref:hypothetical protein n=1 Tax=Okeania sp. SIO2C2 TaxID=2607787 RepID=UPI0013BA6CED|nr:hypothetical protein [Okeania sp. SIO2C2]NEP88679.1 hypothetical protein [Okeania sp. SIO2C2]
MTDVIINHAQKFGFFCNYDLLGFWQIVSHPRTPVWKLRQQKEDWLLLISDEPHLILLPEEVIAFLRWRWSTKKK